MAQIVDGRVRAVIDLMKASLHRQLSVSEMAEAVQLSPTHLRLLFKQETGMPVARYLQELRMERARELLETTFLSVKEIAGRVGINSASHFVASFKRNYGARPGEYLTRYRRTKPERNQ